MGSSMNQDRCSGFCGGGRAAGGDEQLRSHSRRLLAQIGRACCLRVFVTAVLALTGCAGTAGKGVSAEGDASVERFARPTPPPDFDRARALLTLDQIPNDPAAPKPPTSAPASELPAAGLQRLAEARRLFSEHRYTETIGELEKVLRYNANNPDANRIMALACLLAGNDSRAQASAERARSLRPDDLGCHYVLGRLADKARKSDEALMHYRTALKCPDLPEGATIRVLTHYHLGLLLHEQRYYTAAIDQIGAFEAGVRSLGGQSKIDPELATIRRVHRAAALLRVARAQTLLGNYAGAVETLSGAATAHPADAEIREEYIAALVRDRRIETAEAEAKGYLADTKGDRQAVKLLLDLYRYLGRPERGVAAIKEVVTAQPENVDLWLMYADALLAARQYPQAAETLNALLIRHPQAGDARWRLIALERQRENWRAWLGQLANHLADQPDEFSRAAEELDKAPAAVAASMVQELVGGDEKHRKLIPPAPEDAKPAAALDYLFGRLCDRQDRIDDARRFFERSIQRMPGFLPAAIGVAELYVQRNRWSDALKVITAAQAGRKEPVAQLERLAGECYDGLDQAKEAVEHFEKAIQLDRTDTATILLLGRLHDRMGNSRDARRQYQAAVVLAPDDLTAREYLVRSLLTAAGSGPRAQAEHTQQARVLSELLEMRRINADHPATVRCSALFEFRYSAEPSGQKYADRLRRLVDLYPDDLRTRADLAAVLLLHLYDYAAALDEAEAMVRRSPYAVEGNELKALAQLRLLRLDEARQQLEKMLAWCPNRVAWLRHLAEVHLIELNYDGAIRTFERLLELPSSSPHTKYRTQQELIECYQEAGRFDKARSLLAQWMTQAAKEAGARMLYRQLLLTTDSKAKDMDTYLRRCREWLKEDPEDQTAGTWLLMGLLEAKRHDEALAVALEMLSKEKDPARPVVFLQLSLQSAGRFDEAIELARSELAAADEDKRLSQLKQLAAVYGRARRYDEMIARLKEYIAKAAEASEEQEVFDARLSLNSALVRARRFDEASRSINAMIDEAESKAVKMLLLQNLSYAYQKQDRMDLAEQRLREAYELSPLDTGINNDLGYTLADAGRELDRAERMIRIAVGENPRRAAYLDSLGWVLYKKGQFEQARIWLIRGAAQEAGQDPVIYDHLGDTYWRLEQKAEAVKAWHKALELHQEKLVEGEVEPADKFVPMVKAKIEAAGKGREPGVAPTAGGQ